MKTAELKVIPVKDLKPAAYNPRKKLKPGDKEYEKIKNSIQEYGIDETDFLNRLDDMVEQAFDDQCTGANPRYPLFKEIKQMYLNAYYGKHFVEQDMPTTDLDEAKVDPIKAPYLKGKKA